MRVVEVVLALIALAPVARAQGIVEVALGDGWQASFPGRPERSTLEDDMGSRPGVLDAHDLVVDGGSFSAASGCMKTTLTGQEAWAELRLRLKRLTDRFANEGEVRVMGVRRRDSGTAVGLEARVSVRRAKDGTVVRFHTRMLLDGRRFLAATYIAARDSYSSDMARWFLDSLGRRADLAVDDDAWNAPDVRAVVSPRGARKDVKASR
jgi:hypothetical protein